MNNFIRKFPQLRAILAITKGSLIATLQNKSSLFFGFLFPLFFVGAFGFIGGNGATFDVGIIEGTEIENPIYKTMEEIDSLELKTGLSSEEADRLLKKGEIVATVEIKDGDVTLLTSGAEPENGQIVSSIVGGIVDTTNIEILKQQSGTDEVPVELTTEVIAGRKYKTIDFILPGQLGFALLSSGVFATSFLFLNLRQTLVLKRYFATPVKKSNILLGEGISKLIYAMLQATVIVGVGVLAFDFTLVNGFLTFLQMLFLAGIGLILFLGFGFLVSSVGKDENSMAPLANLITLPQFILSGSFFPIENFPTWLQPVSKILPLTYLNEAMRKVAFDGVSLLSLGKEIGILLIWTVIVYAIAVKIFKWEN